MYYERATNVDEFIKMLDPALDYVEHIYQKDKIASLQLNQTVRLLHAHIAEQNQPEFILCIRENFRIFQSRIIRLLYK